MLGLSRRLKAGFFGVSAFVLAAAACVPAAPAAPAAGQSGTGAATGATPAASASNKIVVGLGGGAPPDPSAHQFYYALEKGFFKEQGVDVTLTPYNGDQTALRALATKEVDVAFVGCGTALAAYEVGSPVRFVSAFTPASDYQMVATKDISDLKGLEGKNLGVSQVGAVSHLVPILMVQAAGADPSKVKAVAIGGSSARVQGLVAKTIDAAVLDASQVPKTASYDYLHVIADGTTALPDFLFSCEVSRTDTLAQKDQAIQAFVTGMMEGTRWFYGHTDEAKAISKKVVPDMDPQAIDFAVDSYAKSKYLSTTGTISQKAFDFTVKALVDAKQLTQPFQLSQVYETKYLDAAAKKLGNP